SPLQMVGVSHCASTSRSAWVKGWSAMTVFLFVEPSRILAPGSGVRQDVGMPSAAPIGHAPGCIATGGKAIYGAPLGILMLEARFPRIPGDMGNATTWPFPVLYRVVKGASPERVVLHEAAGLLPQFLRAAAELVAEGAEAITTNCGFLSLFQQELAAHV